MYTGLGSVMPTSDSAPCSLLRLAFIRECYRLGRPSDYYRLGSCVLGPYPEVVWSTGQRWLPSKAR